MDRKEVGVLGERAAADWYTKNGYKIAAQNFKTQFGELDVVAIKGRQTVICEVKTRSDKSKIAPAYSVGRAKQQKLALAAKAFLQQEGLLDSMVRFDVAELYHNSFEITSINIIENAFEIY